MQKDAVLKKGQGTRISNNKECAFIRILTFLSEWVLAAEREKRVKKQFIMSKGPAKPQVKSDRYSAKDDTDELEVITDKLAVDLRKSIRQLVK